MARFFIPCWGLGLRPGRTLCKADREAQKGRLIPCPPTDWVERAAWQPGRVQRRVRACIPNYRRDPTTLVDWRDPTGCLVRIKSLIAVAQVRGVQVKRLKSRRLWVVLRDPCRANPGRSLARPVTAHRGLSRHQRPDRSASRSMRVSPMDPHHRPSPRPLIWSHS